MGNTFEDLLAELVAYRERDYSSDPEREDARIEAIEYVLQTTLEKLRDMHDK